MRRKFVRMGLAIGTAIALLTLAPGPALADGCIWVDREGVLRTFNEGDVLSIMMHDGSWENWQCINGSWKYVGAGDEGGGGLEY
jgi:hypothetical protein